MLARILFVWLALVLALWVSSRVIPGVHFRSGVALWGGSVVLALLDAILGPFLLITTFPLTVITYGLFAFVVNGVIVLLAARLVPGFDVDGLFPAFNAGLVLAAFGIAGYLLAEWYLFGTIQWNLGWVQMDRI